MPGAKKQSLSRKNIFIIPSKFGFSFLFFIFLLFILGTNYQNNLILFFSYLLSSLFVSAMFHCFFNLSGLTIEVKGEYAGFDQQTIYIPVVLSSEKQHFSLAMNFPIQNTVAINQTNENTNKKQSNNSTQVELPLSLNSRGIFTVGRLKLASEYSLGLFHCWTKLDLALAVTVYPKPLASSEIPFQQGFNESDDKNVSAQTIAGQDDFAELTRYRVGEPLSQVAWKQVARGQGWHSKRYEQQQGGTTWLSLQAMPSSQLEDKLRLLCYAILQCQQQNSEFGIELGSLTIAPGEGREHVTRCLTALAIYGQVDD